MAAEVGIFGLGFMSAPVALGVPATNIVLDLGGPVDSISKDIDTIIIDYFV